MPQRRTGFLSLVSPKSRLIVLVDIFFSKCTSNHFVDALIQCVVLSILDSFPFLTCRRTRRSILSNDDGPTGGSDLPLSASCCQLSWPNLPFLYRTYQANIIAWTLLFRTPILLSRRLSSLPNRSQLTLLTLCNLQSMASSFRKRWTTARWCTHMSGANKSDRVYKGKYIKEGLQAFAEVSLPPFLIPAIDVGMSRGRNAHLCQRILQKLWKNNKPSVILLCVEISHRSMIFSHYLRVSSANLQSSASPNIEGCRKFEGNCQACTERRGPPFSWSSDPFEFIIKRGLPLLLSTPVAALIPCESPQSRRFVQPTSFF